MNKLNATKFIVLGFILVLLLLHLLDSSVNPNWQPISEYALGNFGWLMNFAFILLGKESKELFANEYLPYLPTEEQLAAEIEREIEQGMVARLMRASS